MLLRPTHSRVIMRAAITGRDSTARYSAMRGPTAAWRAMAQGGPHQEAMAISLSRSRLLPPDDQEGNEESPRDGSALGQAKHVASGDEIPDRRSCGSDQNNGQPIKRQQKKPRPPRPARNNTATMGESRIDAPASSSRPMLCEQKSPITVPNVPEMNMQT